jgi:hypothetical protein
VAAAILLGSHAAHAVGLGRPQTLSSLGQPLHLAFPLSLGVGESLAPECVSAEVLAGDMRLPHGTVQIELEGPTQTSVRALRLRSTQQISEPIVSVNLQLGCPTRLVRQFTAFIDPPDVDTAAAVVPPPAVVVRQYTPQMQAALATSEARPAQLLAPLPQSSAELARVPAVEPLRNAGQVVLPPAPARSASTIETPRDVGDSRPAAPAALAAASKPAAKRPEADKPAAATPSAPPRAEAKAGPKPTEKANEKPSEKTAGKPIEDRPQAAAAPASVAAPRLRLEPAEVLNDKAAVSQVAAASEAPASAASAAASAAGLPEGEAERLVRLEQGLKLLQFEQREAQGQIGTLRRQLDQARAERYMNPLVYGLGAAVLLLFGLVAFLWRSRQRERLMLESQWWREVRDEVQHAPAQGEAAAPAPQATAAAPATAQEAPAPEAASGSAKPAAPTGALAGLHVEYHHEPPLAVPTLELSQELSAEMLAPAQMPRFEATGPMPAEEATLGLPTPSAAAPEAELSAPMPEPVLEPISFQFIEPAPAPAVPQRAVARINVEELIDLEQQAEFFIVLGQDEAAIELLTRRIDDDARDVALPYLKLLRIYQRRGQRHEFETLAREFAERFGRPIPGWIESLDHGAGLEGQPEVLRLVQRRWGDSAATMSLLQAMLVGHAEQGSVPEVLPVGAYDLCTQADLLMLYGVARDISEHEVRGEDVDLFLPLDSKSASAPATGMMATMIWQRPGNTPLGAPGPLEVDISLDDPEPPRPAQS